jgi:hypothetical protein
MSYDSWKLDNGETAESMARDRAGEAAAGRVAAALGPFCDEVSTADFDSDGDPMLDVRLSRFLFSAADGDECEMLALHLEALVKRLRRKNL